MLTALRLPVFAPEPEVSKAAVKRAQGRALAALIEQFINEQEPSLSATRDGAVVTVREKGGDGVFTVDVTAG